MNKYYVSIHQIEHIIKPEQNNSNIISSSVMDTICDSYESDATLYN